MGARSRAGIGVPSAIVGELGGGGDDGAASRAADLRAGADRTAARRARGWAGGSASGAADGHRPCGYRLAQRDGSAVAVTRRLAREVEPSCCHKCRASAASAAAASASAASAASAAAASASAASAAAASAAGTSAHPTQAGRCGEASAWRSPEARRPRRQARPGAEATSR